MKEYPHDRLSILTQAREVIRNPLRWCKNAIAKDSIGRPVGLTSRKVNSRCAVGAIYSTAYKGNGHKKFAEKHCEETVQYFDHFLRTQDREHGIVDKDGDRYLYTTGLNDSRDTNHAKLMRAFDAVIKKAADEQSVKGDDYGARPVRLPD